MYFNIFSLCIILVCLEPSKVYGGLNEDMIEFFERLKIWMPYMDCPSLTGVDLPVMEPLIMTQLDFYLDHEIGKLKGSFSDMHITNLSTFEVDVFKIVLITRDFEAVVSIPELNINGSYTIDGNIGELIPITGEGPLEITLKDMRVGVKGKLAVLPMGIQELSIAFNISEFKGYFHGLMGEQELEEVFNKLINDIALEALEVLWPEIEEGLVQTIKEMAGQMLGDLTIQDLLKIMQEIKTMLPAEVPEECKETKLYYTTN